MFIAIFILVTGTVGFMFIEGYTFLEALYMTVITITTVGFTEVKPLSDGGRLFTIIFILLTFGVFTFYISQVASIFFDDDLKRLRKIHRMKNKIQNLSEHVIICGYGRNGNEAGVVLSRNKIPFVVIEKNYSNEMERPEFYLEADATKDETLLEAGVKKAKALITTLPEDAANLFVVLTAKELNPKLQIITRASQDTSVKKLRTAGAHNVIMPDKIGGAHMAALVSNPDIKEFIDLLSTASDETLIREMLSKKKFSLADFDCWNRTGATILGIKKSDGSYTLNPMRDAGVEAGEKLIFIGRKNQLTEAEKWLHS